MYRSWAYILIVMATLVGIVALLWPSPQVRSIEEIASAAKEPPRGEAPAKSAKPGAKQPSSKPAAKPATPAPAPPAVVKKMPAPNTTTRRAGPLMQNGLEPNPFAGLAGPGGAVGGAAPPPPLGKPGPAARPINPSRPAAPPPPAGSAPQEPVRP